jgi:hypothetical protein
MYILRLPFIIVGPDVGVLNIETVLVAQGDKKVIAN